MRLSRDRLEQLQTTLHPYDPQLLWAQLQLGMLLAAAGDLQQRMQADTAMGAVQPTGGFGGQRFDPGYMAEPAALLSGALSGLRATDDDEAARLHAALRALGAIQLAQGRLQDAAATLGPIGDPMLHAVRREAGLNLAQQQHQRAAGGFLQFTVDGIPVHVHASFVLIVALLGSSWAPNDVITFAAIIAVSVLLHELGHALVLRAYGSTPRIDLQGMGGFTSRQDGRPLPSLRSAIVSYAGIAVNLALAGGTFLLTRTALPVPSSGQLRVLVIGTIAINVALAVFNVLPLLPLDGGRALAALLHRVFGARGITAAVVISFALLAVLGLAAVLTGAWWTALVLLWCLMANLQLARLGPRAVAALGFEDRPG